MLAALIKMGGPLNTARSADELLDVDLDDLGYDSLARLGALVDLEDGFGLKAGPDADSAYTIRQIIEAFAVDA
ncbi:MAG: phosphopantetheine-binding protein [Propionibacteriaceae bacterium]|nr:phosphopantetheine-binding protein [Propionibacteriaceae bacterium]